MSELTLHDKLLDIQRRLKVPKDNNNEFGGFKYRNIEDIEDKVKPLLSEHKLTLRFSDNMIAVGDRVYVEATAILSDGKDHIESVACAREAASPKAKTDDAQLTGGCSSYARKYAASGLFLIDNTKDADSEENRPPAKAQAITANPEATVSATQIKALFAVMKGKGYTDSEEVKAILRNLTQVDSLNDLTHAQASKLLEKLKTMNKALLDAFFSKVEA